jgi:hypothetical protein
MVIGPALDGKRRSRGVGAQPETTVADLPRLPDARCQGVALTDRAWR